MKKFYIFRLKKRTKNMTFFVIIIIFDWCSDDLIPIHVQRMMMKIIILPKRNVQNLYIPYIDCKWTGGACAYQKQNQCSIWKPRIQKKMRKKLISTKILRNNKPVWNKQTKKSKSHCLIVLESNRFSIFSIPS